MLLDFNEIPRFGGDSFEAFAHEFLTTYGYQPDTPPSFGADGGCDFVVCDPGFGLAQCGLRWLVSCKHTQSHVGLRDDRADHRKLGQFGCQGFILVYSSVMTNSVKDSYEALRRNYGVPYQSFGPYELEGIIVSDVKYAWLVRRFMPQSFERLYAVRDAMKVDCCPTFNAFIDDLYVIVHPDGYGSNKVIPCCEGCMSYYKDSLDLSSTPYCWMLMQKASCPTW